MAQVQITALMVTLTLVTLLSSGQSVTKRYDLTVSESATTPDGVRKPCTLQYNSQFPGPPITALQNDFLSVQVWNNLSDPTSVHWHGMHQNGTQFEDGPSSITQCPIQPNQTQRYFFQARQSGTYWYHAHYDSQYTDGLIGPLIIYDPSDPGYYGYEPDAEIVIVISDWYRWGYKINQMFHNRTGIPPFPHSALINGRGQFPCLVDMVEETLAGLGLPLKEFIGTKDCDTRKQSRALFFIKPGTVVRIRVINASAMSAFTFFIDKHKLLPIEVDGVSVDRESTGHPVDYAYLGAAQRYSFLVKMDQGTGSKGDETFNIRAVIDTEFFTAFGKIPNLNLNSKWTLQPQATAGLVYAKGKVDSAPTTSSQQFSYTDANKLLDDLKFGGRILDDLKLRPRDGEVAPKYPDLEFVLNIGLIPTPVPYSLFNGKPIKLPEDWETPLLMQLVEGKFLKNSTNPLYIGHNQAAQIIFNNYEPFAHPIHLHGNDFWIVGKGKDFSGPFIPDVHASKLKVKTVKRDTAVVKAGSWMVIRIVGNNPGVWMLHCHLDWHNVGGMAMTVVVAKEKLEGIPIPDEAKRVCRQRQSKN